MEIKMANADAKDLLDYSEEEDLETMLMYADMLQRRAKSIYSTIREKYMEEEE